MINWSKRIFLPSDLVPSDLVPSDLVPSDLPDQESDHSPAMMTSIPKSSSIF